jgi:hypothetical protein
MSSSTGAHEVPPLVLRQMPPPTLPAHRCEGLAGSMTRLRVRPPMLFGPRSTQPKRPMPALSCASWNAALASRCARAIATLAGSNTPFSSRQRCRRHSIASSGPPGIASGARRRPVLASRARLRSLRSRIGARIASTSTTSAVAAVSVAAAGRGLLDTEAEHAANSAATTRAERMGGRRAGRAAQHSRAAAIDQTTVTVSSTARSACTTPLVSGWCTSTQPSPS